MSGESAPSGASVRAVVAPRIWTGSARVGDAEIHLETGRIARQADGAVLVREGDTTLLVTAVAAAAPRAGIDFFPLTVKYRERFSAAGRFPGCARVICRRCAHRTCIWTPRNWSTWISMRRRSGNWRAAPNTSKAG